MNHPRPQIERAVFITARILEARRLLQRVLPDYDSVVRPWRDALARRPEGFMSAALEVLKRLEADGRGEAIPAVLAAVADLADREASNPLRR